MKHPLSFLVLTLTLTTMGWRTNNAGKITPTLPAKATTVNCTPVGRILSVENDRQLTGGKLLCPDEQIQPAAGAKVTVLCHTNGELWTVPSGKISTVESGCPLESARNDSCPNPDPKYGCLDPRGPGAGSNTPEIIPNNTNLSNNKPQLSWYAVPNATRYTVRVSDITDKGVSWERIVDNPTAKSGIITINYPPDVEPLQPGNTYQIIVESIDGQVSPGEGIFTMLSQDKIAEVQGIEQKLNQYNLPQEEKILLDLYSVDKNRNLIAELIQKLEQLAVNSTKTAKVYRLLGDRYFQQGLVDLAKDRYETAVDLAIKSEDNQELQEAEDGLNRVKEKIDQN